ncbi:MAG TPA: hypothetical protein ENK34_11700 [Rhodobacteraceae bacterium]|nr:hypothetical protein [Paracoccaceae bacterium]
MKRSGQLLKHVLVSVLKAHFRALRYMKKHSIISGILIIPVMTILAALLEAFLGFVAGLSEGVEETLPFKIMGGALALYVSLVAFGLMVAFANVFGTKFKILDKIEDRLLGDE